MVGRNDPCGDASATPVCPTFYLPQLACHDSHVTAATPPNRGSTSGHRRRRRESYSVATSPHPDAQPYEGGSGSVGVLLCHGYCGSTKSMMGWAKYLETAGFRVLVPRLPGHGTSWQELNETTWMDWYDCVDDAFMTLRATCDQVFVAGLSMGAALALRLAARHGPEVSGLVLVNPAIKITEPWTSVFLLRALPLLQLVIPSWTGIANNIAKPGQDECGYDRNPLRAMYSQTFLWADVRRNLDQVHQPVLVYRSTNDHLVDPSSVQLIKTGIRSSDQEYVELQRSYHVATLDYDAEDIFAGSVAFFRRLTKEADGTAE
jgi:carboxylesterase